MPLTPFQRDVLAVLAANRSEESDFAGGVLLHASDDSPRFSRDFDIFHDLALEVVRASERDVTSLRAADSAFRFFPVERDALLGWRLHRFDAATNKALTLAARTETRDYVDIVEVARMYPLAAICWAACGKDPGFTPLSLLKMMRRFARIDPVELDKIRARALDPIALKTAWVALSDEAEVRMTTLADTRPDVPIGVAFVDPSGTPGWIGDDPDLRIHAPSIRGCWPRVRGLDLE